MKFVMSLVTVALLFLAVPRAALAQAATFKATLTWVDNSDNEDGFKVEKSSSQGGTFAEIASVAAGVVSYVDQPLDAGTAVCYRIKAFNVAGNSAPSPVACGNTPALPAGPGTTQIVITIATGPGPETSAAKAKAKAAEKPKK
jgi:hypothetical protein